MLTWNDLPLSNGWTNYGSGYQTAQYAIDFQGRVWTRGFLMAPAMPVTGVAIASLPPGYRPTGLIQSFQITSSNQTNAGGIQFDIETSGNIIYQFPAIPGNSLVPINFSFTTN